jgi:RNA polymerase sigma-70 factor (ECF subfamily)
MTVLTPGPDTPIGKKGFPSTYWPLVVDAHSGTTTTGGAALAKLCEAYWYPLFAYVRRCGYSREEAEDLTQGFFSQLLDKRLIAAASQERGKFRSLLLAGIKRYMANDWDRRKTQKRGGDTMLVSLSLDDFEKEYSREPVENVTPEELYHRRWALLILERAMDNLFQEQVKQGEARFYLELKDYLLEESDNSCAEIARRFTTSTGAIKVRLHRMRKRLGELIRLEIGPTVNSAPALDEELQLLLQALAKR